jgi:hypothetical protein
MCVGYTYIIITWPGSTVKEFSTLWGNGYVNVRVFYAYIVIIINLTLLKRIFGLTVCSTGHNKTLHV